MSWIRQNKFLAGFLGVLLLGAAIFTFLILSSSARLAAVSESYSAQEQELNRLQSLKPFPETANLKLLKDQKATFDLSAT